MDEDFDLVQMTKTIPIQASFVFIKIKRSEYEY